MQRKSRSTSPAQTVFAVAASASPCPSRPPVVQPARVRPLAPGDRAAVTRIDAEQTGTAKPAYWQRIFREFLRSEGGVPRVGLAAECDGEVAGFLFGDVRAFEFGSEPCGWILEVGVDPRFTRRGVATALLRAGCAHLRTTGVGVIRTMVRRTDVPMLTFFRTNGFAAGPYMQLELPPGGEW